MMKYVVSCSTETWIYKTAGQPAVGSERDNNQVYLPVTKGKTNLTTEGVQMSGRNERTNSPRSVTCSWPRHKLGREMCGEGVVREGWNVLGKCPVGKFVEGGIVRGNVRGMFREKYLGNVRIPIQDYTRLHVQLLWFVTPWLTYTDTDTHTNIYGQLLTSYTISSASWAKN